MNNSFKALVVDNKNHDMTLEIQEIPVEQLPDGDVTIKVVYSSINYKDGLASIPNGGIVRSYPFIPGIDLAGVVVESVDSRFKTGDEVLVTGYDLGVSHFGGFSELARVPADWIVPLPKGLSLKEAMIIGTAGFTAALSIHKLEENHIKPENGPILVTGATGGVGSSAVAMLSKLGYRVTASSRKADEFEFLKKLGAEDIINPEELSNPKKRPLLKQQWAAAVDPVAGEYLPVILASIQYGGAVAVSGLTGGNQIHSTVFPFILRGVNLLGIDSVYCPMETRLLLWNRMANEMKPSQLLSEGYHELSLTELPQALMKILKGEMRGRTIVKIAQ